MASEKLQKLINACERSIKNNQLSLLRKNIKKLRALNQLDVLMKIDKESLTLLMFFAKRNMVADAKELLSGTNAASVTATNASGENALFMAIAPVALDPNHDLTLITSLLERDPETQLLQAKADGFISFHAALYPGYIPLIELLLKVAPEKQLLATTAKNDSVVDFASESMNPDLLEWLFERYHFLQELKGQNGFTPLHNASRKGNLARIQYLLRSNPEARVMMRDGDGCLPISMACIGNHVGAVKELLRYCGKEQLEDAQHGSAIFFACMAGSLESLQILFGTAKATGADLSRSLLHTTALPKLLQAALPENSPCSGDTPLHAIIYSPRSNVKRKLAMVELLLTVAADEQLEFQSEDDLSTALHASVDADLILIAQQLTAYTNTKQYLLKDKNNRTALLLALEQGRKAEAELLFNKGPTGQYASPDSNGMHALIHLMRQNYFELFENMASQMTEEELFAISDGPFPLLHMALMRPPMLNLLVKKSPKKLLIQSRDKTFNGTALHTAIKSFDEQVVSVLLAHGSDVNAQDMNGWAPIHVVCSTNNMAYFKILCSYSPDFNVRISTGETPLHIAAARGYVEIVKALLGRGVEPEPQNTKGMTPLGFAVVYNHIQVLEALLQSKANPNQLLLSKMHVLTFALYKLNFKMIQVLLRNGVDTSCFVSTNPLITFRNHVTEQASKGDLFCQKINAVMKDLQLIPAGVDAPQVPLPYQNFSLEDLAISSRGFLKELGLSDEQLLALEEERKYKLVKRNPHEFKFIEPLRTEETITWLNGKVTSIAAFVHPIRSHGVLAYCYFDEAALIQQGCDIKSIKLQRLKFDGYHIKELDKAKGIYSTTVKLTSNNPERPITYTHEFKVTAVDRILLFPIPSDKPIKTNKTMCSPSLYIGLRFISGGLHTFASIKSLTDSMAASSSANCLVVQWPTAVTTEDNLRPKP